MSSDSISSQTAPSVPPDERPATVGGGQQFPPRRVLIIESDLEVADQLVQIVEAQEHKTEIASDAKTALLHLRDFKPHLVFLGTYLADMPGYELTAILRAAPQYSGLLHAVGLLFIADRSKLLKHRLVGAPDIPMSNYIFKPLNSVEVRDKMEREIARVIAQRYAPSK